MSRETRETTDDLLSSWKDVATYLDTSVRTVQRWEKLEQLPVHRQQHAKQGSIYAYKSEIERWRESRTLPAAPSRPLEQPAQLDTGDWQEEIDRLTATLASGSNADTRPVRDGSASTVVGRDSVLAELTRGFDEAVANRTPLIFTMGGEPGLGKTTTFDAFVALLEREDRQCLVARGRCSERLAGEEAYLPILEALESMLSLTAGETIGRLMQLLAPSWYLRIAPLWAATDPKFARVAEEAKSASKERMKRELLSFMRTLSDARPAIVFLDDLHWADESTVELLAYVAKNGAPLRGITVAAYRTTELIVSDHAFLAVKRELQERSIGYELSMPLLSGDDVAAYLDATYPNHEFPEDFAKFVHQQTEGNPLFMADLVRELDARGVIETTGSGSRLTCPVEDARRTLPQSIRSMIERKVERLESRDRELLCAAAVQGYEFDSLILADALGASPVEVEDRLLELDRTHTLLRAGKEAELPDGNPTLRSQFVHVLYQHALIDSMTPSRRVALAKAVADALERRYGERAAEIAANLAVLYEDARDRERAARYYLLAAENTIALHAFPEASALTERAGQIALKLSPEDRGPLLLDQAFLKIRIDYNQGLFENLPVVCRKTEELTIQLGDVEARIDAICALAVSLFYLKRLDEADAEAARAMELARETRSELAIASAEAVFALVRLSFGDLARAETYFDRAIPVIRSNAARPHAVDAISYRIMLHAWRLEYAEVEQAAAWIRESALRAGTTLCSIYFTRAMASGNQGRLTEALAFAQEGRKLAELNEDKYFISRMPNVIAWLCGEAYDRESALTLNEESVVLAKELGFEEAEANAHVNLAGMYSALGELDTADSHIKVAEKLFEDDLWFRWRYNIRLQATKAEISIARGDLTMAAQQAQTSLELARDSLARKHVAGARKLQGDIAALEDRIDDSIDRYREALSGLSEHPCPTVQWRTLFALAESLRKKRLVAEADEFVTKAKQQLSIIGSGLRDEDLRRTFYAAKTTRDLGIRE